jgi:hypothetical protein
MINIIWIQIFCTTLKIDDMLRNLNINLVQPELTT